MVLIKEFKNFNWLMILSKRGIYLFQTGHQKWNDWKIIFFNLVFCWFPNYILMTAVFIHFMKYLKQFCLSSLSITHFVFQLLFYRCFLIWCKYFYANAMHISSLIKSLSFFPICMGDYIDELHYIWYEWFHAYLCF